MINDKTLELIKHFESLHDGDLSVIGLQPKQCPAGIWTIGWGHALSTPDGGRLLKGLADKHEAYRQAGSITIEEADATLVRDIEVFQRAVERLVKVPLNENQLGAVVSFTFNIGSRALRGSTLLALINRGDFQGAAEQFHRWNKSGGKVLKGLTLRRAAESELFLTHP